MAININVLNAVQKNKRRFAPWPYDLPSHSFDYVYIIRHDFPSVEQASNTIKKVVDQNQVCMKNHMETYDLTSEAKTVVRKGWQNTCDMKEQDEGDYQQLKQRWGKEGLGCGLTITKGI